MSSVKDILSILSESRISRTLTRIAFQIREDNTENLPVALFGIDERGFALARIVCQELIQLGVPASVLQLFIKKTSDTPISISKNNCFCIIMDDVIFSGSTMFKALSNLQSQLKPPVLKTAALVDRGHRIFPVSSDYTGIICPTKFNEHVECVFYEDGTPRAVIIERL